jgi:hypothetical protein
MRATLFAVGCMPLLGGAVKRFMLSAVFD